MKPAGPIPLRILLATVLAACFASPPGALAGERKFLSGYAGSLPSRDDDRAGTYFPRPAVRALLARLEGGPLADSQAEAILARSGTTIADLLRVGILRREKGRLSIGFAYFTADDMRRIGAVVDRLAPSLAEAYRSKKRDFDAAFAAYPAGTVPRSEIAFILLAGFCLNWDGLKVTRDLGLRRPLLVEGQDFRYSFWASEEIPGREDREIYWGSSTFPLAAADRTDPAAYSFSSFGDPESDPRMNFPDLPFLSSGDLASGVRLRAEAVGLRDTDELGHHFEKVLGGAVFEPTSRILFALRQKPRSAGEIATLIGRDPAALLALLEEIQYVERGEDGLYHLRAPVFDAGDAAMIDRTIATSREILRRWLRDHDPGLRRELAGMTAMRAGLPFEALFTQIWHEIFGRATRELVRNGMIESAYDPSRRYKGSLSVLWRQSLYEFIPG